MRRKMAVAIVALGLASVSASACGMTPAPASTDRCRVIGGDKLPADTGGSRQICASIEAAAESRAPGTGYSVEVQVLSDYMLAARVRMADGRALPEQKLAVSDRKLSRRAIDQFAMAIAEAIGRAGGR